MKFSVIVCTYNGEKFIKAQLESILYQSIIPDEIIISDDGSRDGTLKIINDVFLASNFVNYKIIQNDKPKGVTENFLSAIKEARGDYIFLSDQDDEWKHNKIEIFKKYAEMKPSEVFFSDGELIDENSVIMRGSLWCAIGFTVGMIKDNTIFDLMLKKSIVTGSAMMISRKLVESLPAYKIPTSGWLHDNYLGFLAALDDSITPIPYKTYGYRQHGDNVVGAQVLTLYQKMKKWVDSVPTIRSEREKNLEKWEGIVPFCASIEKREKIDRCIRFWRDLCMIENKRKLYGLFIIARNAHNYNLFYTGLRGMVKDIVSLF